MTDIPLFEVWKVEGRNRTLVARFRRRQDAVIYLNRFGEEMTLELVSNGHRRTRPPRPTPPTRRHSDIVAAQPHPDEFIADHEDSG